MIEDERTEHPGSASVTRISDRQSRDDEPTRSELSELSAPEVSGHRERQTWQAFSDGVLELHRCADLDSLLRQLPAAAVEVLGADGAAVLRHDRGHWEIAAAHDARSQRAAEITIGSGEYSSRPPSPPAVNDVTSVRQLFSLAGLGWRLTRSLRLSTATSSFGVLNLYFGADDASREAGPRVELMSDFARHASVAITRVVEAEALTHLLDVHTLVAQAQGIVMNQYFLGAATAMTVMMSAAEQADLSLYDVAEHVIGTHTLPGPTALGAGRVVDQTTEDS